MAWQRNNRTKEAVDEVYTDVVVDLETLSTETDAVVLSIGAVRIHPRSHDRAGYFSEDRVFYARLDEEEQEENGRDVSEETVAWWKAQSKEARKVFKEKREPVLSCLTRFANFCKGARRIWGNSNMFDNAILRDLYEEYELEYPVPFRKDLDLRTALWIWRETFPHMKGRLPDDNEVEYNHTALDDAKAEALGLQQIMRELRHGTKEAKE